MSYHGKELSRRVNSVAGCLFFLVVSPAFFISGQFDILPVRGTRSSGAENGDRLIPVLPGGNISVRKPFRPFPGDDRFSGGGAPGALSQHQRRRNQSLTAGPAYLRVVAAGVDDLLGGDGPLPEVLVD